MSTRVPQLERVDHFWRGQTLAVKAAKMFRFGMLKKPVLANVLGACAPFLAYPLQWDNLRNYIPCTRDNDEIVDATSWEFPSSHYLLMPGKWRIPLG